MRKSKVPEGKIFILVSKRVMLEVQKDVDEPGPPLFTLKLSLCNIGFVELVMLSLM